MFCQNIKTINAILATAAMLSILISSNKTICSDRAPTDQELIDAQNAETQFSREEWPADTPVAATVTAAEFQFVKAIQALITEQAGLTSTREPQNEELLGLISRLSQLITTTHGQSQSDLGPRVAAPTTVAEEFTGVAPHLSPRNLHPNASKASHSIKQIVEESKEEPAIAIKQIVEESKEEPAIDPSTTKPFARPFLFPPKIKPSSELDLSTKPAESQLAALETRKPTRLPDSPKETSAPVSTTQPHVQEFLYADPTVIPQSNTGGVKFSTTASHVVCTIDFLHNHQD